MNHHVVVLGGGVAGMSAAHELAERDFQVTVYDKNPIPGGKARSFGVPNTGVDGRKDLPAEHGFRFFPGFYQHLPDTMKRIPYGNNPEGAFDNLVAATEMQILFQKRQHIVLPARFPRSLSEITAVLRAANYLTTETGLTTDDIAFYSERVWQLLTSSEERRAAEFEGKSWWDYIDADNEKRTDVYRAYLGSSPRVLVAADPKKANTKTVGDILLQLLFNVVEPGVAADRVLNGPTNDVWIDPWLRHLESRGVRYERNASVIGFRCNGDRIAAVTIRKDGKDQEVTADFYVAALPVEKMAPLITPRMLKLDPTLEGIKRLAKHVDWMSGIQFYLREEVPLSFGHQMFLGSPWALTSISQAQFWNDAGDFASHYGDGTVRTVLSVDVSDWTKKGTNKKTGKECTRDEVAAEVWQQLKDSLRDPLRDEFRHPTTPFHLDPAIQPMNGVLDNDEPLLVNEPDSWQFRPWARTRIPNLFLASDYVRTYTNLATMEAANEAARRAVNAIIDVSGARAEPCDVWELHEPFWLKPWRWWDLQQYRQGRRWAAELPDFVEAMARGVLESAPAIGGSDDYADATAREVVERGVPLVPTYVQREVADLMLEVGSTLERGDLAGLRSLFLPGALVALNDPDEPRDTARWFEDLEDRVGRGERMVVDIRSLQDIRPRGLQVVARFAAHMVGGRRSTSGRFECICERAPEGTPGAERGVWTWGIRELRYTVV